MSIFIKVYTLIFKSINGITSNLIIFSVFLCMIFHTLANSEEILDLGNEFFVYMNIGRTVSILMILLCILAKSFQLIFGKGRDKNYEST